MRILSIGKGRERSISGGEMGNGIEIRIPGFV
jgi:hypothetical protein